MSSIINHFKSPGQFQPKINHFNIIVVITRKGRVKTKIGIARTNDNDQQSAIFIKAIIINIKYNIKVEKDKRLFYKKNIEQFVMKSWGIKLSQYFTVKQDKQWFYKKKIEQLNDEWVLMKKWWNGLLNKWIINVVTYLFMVDVHVQGSYPHMV